MEHHWIANKGLRMRTAIASVGCIVLMLFGLYRRVNAPLVHIWPNTYRMKF
jgi:hypothetical protein